MTNDFPSVGRAIATEVGSIRPLNFSCDFNYGRGNNYYVNGIQCLSHKWSNLIEFDFSLACRNGNGIHWPTFEGDHWTGGSSLVL